MTSFGGRTDQITAASAAGVGSAPSDNAHRNLGGTTHLAETQAGHGHKHDHAHEGYPSTMRPSEQAPPTVVDTATQQASTQPGDGREVHVHEGESVEPQVVTRNPNLTESGKVPFKEQVIGVAKKTRGTLLGNPETKEHGQQILEGKVTHTQGPL